MGEALPLQSHHANLSLPDRTKISLPDNVREALANHPDYAEADGKRGGISGLIVSILAQSLGLEEPSDYHREMSERWARRRRVAEAAEE